MSSALGVGAMLLLVLRALTASLVCVSLVLAACGGDGGDEGGSGAGESAESSPVAEGPGGNEPSRKQSSGASEQAGEPGITIAAAESQFGTILFDEDDRAIYLFDKETSERSECYGACPEAWPPVLTDGEPEAEGGADAELLGTTTRDDGSIQVTYAGQPLYYYVDDPPGEVLCHNVEEFGGLWLVVEPGGEAVS